MYIPVFLYLCIVKKKLSYMRINKLYNTDMWDALFENKENYYKWAGKFSAWNQEMSHKHGKLAGVMAPASLIINDDCARDFENWVRELGVEIS